jgi:lipid II isoglutaminyl synthase (glutamine-hydrolysing)
VARKPIQLKLAHLYPRLMNLYGDRGNIISLRYRCKARGIELQVDELERGDKLSWKDYDMFFIGGAQDRQQQNVSADLEQVKGKPLKEAAEHGSVILAVCGGYQMIGRFYRAGDGSELPGLGILDLHTEHPGEEAPRFVGNVVAQWNGATLVGFENHGGRTYLGEKATPLATIVSGYGNNGKDGTEGAVYKNVYGTYIHGSLLPKNPAFADHLIGLALTRRHKGSTLLPIDDRVEESAHADAVRLATGGSIIG